MTDLLRRENRAIVVLAGGASSRMGTHKQLLPYNGKTLLQRILDAAKKANAGCVVAVLGAHAAEIATTLHLNSEEVILNDQWQEGMASSIRAGLQGVLKKNPTTAEIAFVVGDQPYLTTEIINSLFSLRTETGKPIAACRYKDGVGTPVVFYHTAFAGLLSLKGEEGAKRIISAQMEQVALLDFPKGFIDIDTAADYRELLEKENKS